MEDICEGEKRGDPLKYHIVTFGCQMNKSDSERIAGDLENKGYKPALDINKADLVVVNMCSVRQSAVNRVFGLVEKLSAQGGELKTILTGCILKKDRTKLGGLFDEIWDKPEKLAVPSKYIPISNGCDNFCTYCAVPHTRGPLICRDHKEILKEVETSVRKGIKEIWLLGQNVNDYRSGTINFAKLLRMVNDIPGDFKIRFTSPNPADFYDELINAMADCKKVAKYLNLPLQSGDNEILKKMNRRYTAKQYKNLVKKIRERMPDINLSTDIIVGFPGETKKQFENTKKLFKELKFNIAYISKYSPRPGTAASRLKDDMPIKEKKRREKCLSKLLQS